MYEQRNELKLTLKPPGSYSVKMTAYMRKAYTYNIQLRRTQQTAHSACSVYYVVIISSTAEPGYNCIETNTMSQVRRPFTFENLWFHNSPRGRLIFDVSMAMVSVPWFYDVWFNKQVNWESRFYAQMEKKAQNVCNEMKSTNKKKSWNESLLTTPPSLVNWEWWIKNPGSTLEQALSTQGVHRNW